MSGFAVHLADEPVSPDVAQRMALAIAPRGRDREAMQVAGPCTLLHAASWTTPEAEREEQPLRHLLRHVWLTVDGRIDNRAELAELLTGRVEHPLDTDADLVAAAYEHWGADFVVRLVGDFAMAIWDAEREELLLARDAVGVRPLYWAASGTGLVAASTLPAVLAAVGGTTVDEDYLTGFLADEPPVDRTIWAGVHRLPAGHLLRLGPSGIVVERWWNPSTEPLPISLDESVVRLREAFDEAVRCRLRARGGVAVELSGGLDSSTIAATAAGLGSAVSLVTTTFPDAEADELDHAAAVAGRVGLDVEVVDVEDIPAYDPRADIAAQRQPLYSIDAADTAARHDAARALGCSVVLSGVGGDEALYGSDLVAADLVGAGRLLAGGRWWRREGLSMPSTLSRVVRAAVRHRVDVRTRHRPAGMLARLDGARRARSRRRGLAWLKAPLPTAADRPAAGSRAKEQQLAYYLSAPHNQAAYEQTDRLAAERHVEVRYPFLDRRVVDLVLRLPEEHVRADGDHRGLHRLAFAGRLPDSVVGRFDKAELSAPFVRKVSTALDRAAAVAALQALDGRVDQAAFLRTYDLGERAVEPESDDPHVFHLWLALSAGLTLDEVGRMYG
ncbi:asparagine synthase-related protein [Aeromicrobium sp. NPDC092404]|uniref:asparagine synthetase B family protein n=1 Tax=Aeromicrobium sp. NPDC092404 TaxID=3154976 RepID=UPI00341D0AA3